MAIWCFWQDPEESYGYCSPHINFEHTEKGPLVDTHKAQIPAHKK